MFKSTLIHLSGTYWSIFASNKLKKRILMIGGTYMKKVSLFLVAILLVITLISGCSSKSLSDTANSTRGEADFEVNNSSGKGVDESAPQPQPSTAEAPKDSGDGFVPTVAVAGAEQEEVFGGEMGTKIIKSGYMAVETLEFDDTTNTIIRKVQQEGGFIASSNIQGVAKGDKAYKPMRTAQFKIRIPSNLFEQFMTDVGELGNVTRNENLGEDVSAQYYDTEARVQTLTLQEERILTILGKAEKLSDILELERELSRVRYEIESQTGTLKKWDSLVSYSSLDIDIYEVEEIKEVEKNPVTLWEKITKGFKTSFKNAVNFLEFMLIFFISAVPFLILFGIIGLVVYLIVRLILKKKE